MMSSPNLLVDYPLFAGLNDTELAILASCLVKRNFARNAYLYHPGNPVLNIYLVESGLVRLFFTNARGQEFLLDLIGAHGVVGMPLFQHDQVRVAGAAVQQDAVVLSFSQENLAHLMKRSPQFSANVYAEMQNVMKKLFIYARSLATISLNGRLANMLLYLTRDVNNQGIKIELELPISQTQMAGWLGASRGRLNRALNRFQQLGLIRVQEQKFMILDRQGLGRMTEEFLIEEE